ncbi:MAG TPA: pitrilysin family protein [Candidatus Paceibacterota bacterium]|nr:pitrilysin family protein [Candidatus Paceibacterota bacterium]
MFKKLTFPNGLRLILAPQPKSLASTILVLVEAGSEYETKSINGLSHFLEHMCFKGTTHRPTHSAISTELDSLGAEYNAFTSQEYTGYWAKAQSHKLPQLIDIVSDLYLNPIVDAAELEKERGVIIEEINMYEDNPMRRVQEIFTALLYGDQPAGWDIAGEKSVIRNVKREEFLKYRSARYIASTTVVVVAGAFNERVVTESIRKLFSGLPKVRAARKPVTTEHQTKPAVLAKFKESDQTHLVLGVRAFDIFDKRRYAIQILADVLGGGMSSRLFRRVREEMGAVYYVRAGSDLFLDHGYFEVSAGSDNARAPQVVKAILEELGRVKKELIPPKELQKAKDHMIGGLILGLETSDEWASYYGGQEIMSRKVVEPGELVRRVNQVKAEDLRALARTIFQDRRLNLALIGPHKTEASFKKLLRL